VHIFWQIYFVWEQILEIAQYTKAFRAYVSSWNTSGFGSWRAIAKLSYVLRSEKWMAKEHAGAKFELSGIRKVRVRSIYACLRKGNVFTCERFPSAWAAAVQWNPEGGHMGWPKENAEMARPGSLNGTNKVKFEEWRTDKLLQLWWWSDAYEKDWLLFPTNRKCEVDCVLNFRHGKNSAKIFGVLWMPWTWWSRINFPTGTVLFNAPCPADKLQNTRSQLCGHPKSHVVLATTKQVSKGLPKPRSHWNPFNPSKTHLRGGPKSRCWAGSQHDNTWNHSSCGADSQSVKVATFRNYHNQCEW